MLRINTRTVLLGTCAAALSLAMANGAMAQTGPAYPFTGDLQINGGGSTLAGPTYIKLFAALTNNGAGGVEYNYAEAGSGNGQLSVLCNDGYQYPAKGVGDQFDSTTGSYIPPTVHFGASDVPLNSYLAGQTQISNFNGNAQQTGCPETAYLPGTDTATGANTGAAASGALIQVPTFGTPVTIAYNTTQATANGNYTFTDAQLCGIFTGKITSWTDPALTGANAIFSSSRRAPTGNITVVYRSDGSGTSALFTSHLQQVCNSSNSNVGSGVVLPGGGTQTFASIFTAGVPANFIGASGSGAVSTAIGLNTNATGQPATGNEGSIGYISPDYTAIAAGQLNEYSLYLMVANVVNGNTLKPYLPNYQATNQALGFIPLPTISGQPSDGVTLVQTNPIPHDGYPIVGYTTMIIPQCYANVNASNAIFNFLSYLWNDPAAQNTIQATGFVPIPNALFQIVNNNVLNPGDANGTGAPGDIDIEDPVICAGNGSAGGFTGTIVGR